MSGLALELRALKHAGPLPAAVVAISGVELEASWY